MTASGPLNEANTLKYSAQFGNESGSNAETDEFKAYRFAARYDTNPGFSVEGFFSQFNRDKNADHLTAQLFAGTARKKGRLGVQYLVPGPTRGRGQHRAGRGAATWCRCSGCGTRSRRSCPLSCASTSTTIRAARGAPGSTTCQSDGDAKFTTTIAGIEYYIHPSVRFSPNVEWVSYGTPVKAGVATPEDDIGRPGDVLLDLVEPRRAAGDVTRN